MTMATPTSPLHAGDSAANERRSSAPTSFLKRPATAAVADKSLSSGRSLGARTVSQRNVQHSVSSGEGKWLKQANKREVQRSLSRSAHSHRSRRSLLSRGLSGRGGGHDDNLAASWHNALANSSHSAGGLGLSRSGTGGRLVKSNHTHGGGDFLSKREEELFSGIRTSKSVEAAEPTTTAIPPAIATGGSKESTDVCAEEEEDDDDEEDEFAKLAAGRASRTAVDFDAGDDAVELSFTEDVGATAAAALPMEYKREAAPETSVEADDDEEGGASASSTSEGSSRVTFSSCTVRYYNTILGDNPFVSSGGPPLSLGWDYDPSATDADVPLDAYESARSHLRRTGWDLVLGRAERERRLLNVGCTRHAIAEGVRDVLKSKNRMRSTVLNLRMSGVEEWMEGCSRAVTRGARMRKSSRCLYDEWIASGGTAAAVTTDMLRVLEPSSLENEEEAETSAEGETALTSSSLMSAKAAGEETSRKGLASGKNSERAAPVGPAFGISRLRMGSLRGERLLLSDDDDDKEEGDEKEGEEAMDIVEGRQKNEDEDKENVTAAAVAVPFAVVDLVFPGSPAAEAGFKKGDGVVKFGKVTGSTNHRNLRAVTDAGAAAAAGERAVSVVVLRRMEEGAEESDDVGLEDGGEQGGSSRASDGAATVVVRLTFRPRPWSGGAGNFGFLLKRCSPSKGTEFCHSLSAKALL